MIVLKRTSRLGKAQVERTGKPVVGNRQQTPRSADDRETRAKVLATGDAVTVVSGPNAGRAGTIVWIGASRFGAGRRLGIEPAEGDVFFASEDAVRDALSRKPAPARS